MWPPAATSPASGLGHLWRRPASRIQFSTEKNPPKDDCEMSELSNIRRLVDHLSSMITDETPDEDVLRVAVTNLISVVNLLESEIRLLYERVGRIEREREAEAERRSVPRK